VRCTIVNRHHAPSGPNDLYIGHPSKWANPFYKVVGIDRVRAYREWLLKQPELMAALPELDGKVLVCSCKPRACHGDVLVELVSKLPKGD
jgi:hypothetical protein